MGGGGSFFSIVKLGAYLFAVWLAGAASKMVGISPIVAEIATGVVLGPNVGNLISVSYAECSAKRDFQCNDTQWLSEWVSDKYEPHGDNPNCTKRANFTKLSSEQCHNGGNKETLAKECQECFDECEKARGVKCREYPDIFTLFGQAGVALMIFESGMHFDLKNIRAIAPAALHHAVVGTLCPIAGGVGLAYFFSSLSGTGDFRSAYATGVSLAPTSIGIALKLLFENGSLRTKFGQIIIASAYLDDVFSLVAFQILEGLPPHSKIGFMTFLPGILGMVLVVFGGYLALKFWPKVIHGALSKVKDREDASFQPRDNLLMLIMILVFVGYSCLSAIIPSGTHLWGCFVAGISFSEVRRAHHTWVHQTKRITVWLLRLFFAGSIAFHIPVHQLVDINAIGKGALMGIFACIGTKLLAGIGTGDIKWVIGWAMCGRAEFAYLIAGRARDLDYLNAEQYVVVIWALLWATVTAPILFSLSLKRYNARRREKQPGNQNLSKDSDDDCDIEQSLNVVKKSGGHISFRVLIVKKLHHEDFDHEIHTFFHEEQLAVTSIHVRRTEENFMGMFGVRARNVVVDTDFLTYLRFQMLKMFDDSELRVVFLPPISEEDIEDEMVKVTAISESDPRFLTKMVAGIQSSGLTIVQTSCELHHPIFVRGLTYYPHEGEHVFSAICQVSPNAPDRRELVRKASEYVKQEVELGKNPVFVETIAYTPDPLRRLMRNEVAIDLVDDHEGDKSPKKVSTMSFFVSITVTVHASVTDVNLRAVGALRNVLSGTCACLDRNSLGVILCRQDHMPLAMVPTILVVAQWLSNDDAMDVGKFCANVKTELTAMLDGFGIPGDAEVHLLDTTRAEGMHLPLYSGILNDRFKGCLKELSVASDVKNRSDSGTDSISTQEGLSRRKSIDMNSPKLI